MSAKSACRFSAWKAQVEAEIRTARKIIVLAVGHPSRGDDAAGLICGEELKKRTGKRAGSRLRVILGFETPESTTGEIRRANPDLVLIIDAARGGRRPGEIFLVEKNKIADEDVSTHRISLRLLVSFLEETIRCRVLVVGIQPRDSSPGRSVSAAVKKSAAALAGFLASLLDENILP